METGGDRFALVSKWNETSEEVTGLADEERVRDDRLELQLGRGESGNRFEGGVKERAEDRVFRLRSGFEPALQEFR